VVCPRFNQAHQIPPPRPSVVDLTSRRATAAHTAAKLTVPIPQAERLRPLPKDELPRICRKPTITVRPGDLGKIDKFRQDRHYLRPTWGRHPSRNRERYRAGQPHPGRHDDRTSTTRPTHSRRKHLTSRLHSSGTRTPNSGPGAPSAPKPPPNPRQHPPSYPPQTHTRSDSTSNRPQKRQDPARSIRSDGIS
jgi:hypothetical protein